MNPREVHLVRMNCRSFTAAELEAKYQATIGKIEDRETEIKHLVSILELLEHEHVRRTANEACAKGLHGYCPGDH